MYKGKGDAMECIIQRDQIVGTWFRQQIEIDDMQFGFMKGKATDAIFYGKTDAGEFLS